jgi:hypothetical protein
MRRKWIQATLRVVTREECVGGRYKGYFIGIPGESNTYVVTQFSYDILVDRTVVIQKKKNLQCSVPTNIFGVHLFTK